MYVILFFNMVFFSSFRYTGVIIPIIFLERNIFWLQANPLSNTCDEFFIRGKLFRFSLENFPPFIYLET